MLVMSAIHAVAKKEMSLGLLFASAVLISSPLTKSVKKDHTIVRVRRGGSKGGGNEREGLVSVSQNSRKYLNGELFLYGVLAFHPLANMYLSLLHLYAINCNE